MDQFIQDIVREAGEAIRPLFLNTGVKYTKNGEHDVVTEADLLSNEILTSRIHGAYQDHGIISEEIPEEHWQTDREYTWIIDPLDGTKMFATGWPLFGVMVALQHEKEIELGAIYFPVTDELLFAKRGGGAWLNGERLQASSRERLDSSFGTASSWSGKWVSPKEQRRRLMAYMEAMLSRNMTGMSIWAICVSVKSVAEGKQDWMFTGGQWWDFAPAKVILEEAGCLVTNGDGKPLVLGEARGLIAANPSLHPQLCDVLGLSCGE
ncbi:TPA: hypothetical protein DDZ10_03260 [Candidatus Uhrbacteria bacterium]|nr:MAG: hypothetical protein A3D69_02510 [Candidatus Uhrbacteria bacterium RIFCSPHIGHO2_02_FULL_54_11]HBL39661.1 hypothetical protein [Candidatus Uhrbacteria bacterium]